MTSEIMHNLMVFYCIGAVIGIIIGLYELCIYKGTKGERAQYGMIIYMGFLSWFTVFAYIYGKVRHSRKN